MGLEAHLLTGASLSVAVAAVLWQWQPPASPAPVDLPTAWPVLDFYVHTPAETAFRCSAALEWMTRWRFAPALVSAAYLIVLRWGTACMATRAPVRLPRLRVAWNLMLSLFSLLAVTRVVPALLLSVAELGVVSAACQAPEGSLGNGAPGLWSLLFVLSKLLELGDTAFLVLQRKPLSLLHVWHHSSVLVWAWQQYVARSGPAVFFVAMNAAVHAPMYLYFAVAEWAPPHGLRRVAMALTTLQTAQMAAGLVLCAACYADRGAAGCAFSAPSAGVSGAVYASYLALFLQFADGAYGLRLRLRLLALRARALVVRRLASPASNGRNGAVKGGVDGDAEADATHAAMPWRAKGLDAQRRFEAACAAVPLYLGSLQPADGLRLYGLYKVATCGEPPADGHKANGHGKPHANGTDGTNGAHNGAHNGTDGTTDGSGAAHANGHGGDDGGGGGRAAVKLRAWRQQAGRGAAACKEDYVALMDAVATRALGPPTCGAAAAATDAAASVVGASPRPLRGLGGLGGMENGGVAASDGWRVRIAGIGRCLPPRVVTNAEVERRGGFAAGAIDRSRAGVVERRRAAPHVTQLDLAAEASREALAAAGVAADELDLIINASAGQSQVIPDGGALLQEALGLTHSGIACWACGATCLSFVVALELAAALLHRPDGRYRTVLVASSEISSAAVDPHDMHTAALFGDGAAAVVVRRAADGEGSRVQRALLQTYSEGARLTQIEGGGTRLPPHPRDDAVDHRQPNPHSQYRHHHFQMDGEGMLRFVARRMPAALEALLPGLSRGLGDIDWVCPHQASGVALDSLALYNWPPERILRTLGELGNCVSASLPLTLYEGVASGKVKRGQTVLLCGTAAGGSFGGIIITY